MTVTIPGGDVEAYLARHEHKEILRFLTAGSVDDGKSTLIGRLLHDSNMVYEDQLATLRKDSAKRSSAGGEVDYSLLVDGLLSEREQGITIDVAYRYFNTARRKFIIADTPGHEQYTRNMATGASTADLAIILIDARQGVLRQTKRHSFIAALLGIRHLVVAVNKMDICGYSREVFEGIRKDYLAFAARLAPFRGGLAPDADVHFIPLSALKGDNVVTASAAMPWYEGVPLLEYLDTVPLDAGRARADLRFPVQYVSRPNLNFRGFAGTLAAGVVRRGDEIVALPSGRTSRVRAIVTYDGELEEASAPMAVTLTLEDEIDVGRGDVICRAESQPQVGRAIEATLVWMNEKPMRPGTTYLIKHATHQIAAEVTTLHGKIDVNTLEVQPATSLALNEIGPVTLTAARPLLFDPYLESRTMGSFILVDRLTNATVGAGMIRASGERGAVAPAGAGGAEQSLVSLEERCLRLGQQPATVWLGGLPPSSIVPVAFALERRLFDEGRTATVVDARAPGEGADPLRAAELARVLNGLGLIAIVAVPGDSAEARRAAEARIGAPFFDASAGEVAEDVAEVDWVARILAALRTRGAVD